MWPKCPNPVAIDDTEVRKTDSCTLACFTFSDFSQFKTFEELVESTALHGAANSSLTASDYKTACS